MLKLSIQCTRLIVVIVQGTSSKKTFRSSGGAQEKGRHDETQFTTKIVPKSSLGLSYFSFSKFSFPVTHLMPYYAETGHSRPLIAGLYQQLLFHA
jgi:hypothetical protein